MMFSKSLSVLLLLLASATADAAPSNRGVRGSSSLTLRNRFLAEDEEASVEATESVEAEEEPSVEKEDEESEDKDDEKKSARARSSAGPSERECEIGKLK